MSKLSSKLKSLNGYKKVQVGTSSPEKLLLMVYNGSIKFLKTAKLLRRKKKGDRSKIYILKAIACVVELISTLNHDESPEIARSLKSLYVYIVDILRKSIQSETDDGIDESLDIMSTLREAWEEAFIIAKTSSSLQKTG